MFAVTVFVALLSIVTCFFFCIHNIIVQANREECVCVCDNNRNRLMIVVKKNIRGISGKKTIKLNLLCMCLSCLADSCWWWWWWMVIVIVVDAKWNHWYRIYLWQAMASERKKNSPPSKFVYNKWEFDIMWNKSKIYLKYGVGFSKENVQQQEQWNELGKKTIITEVLKPLVCRVIVTGI